MSLQVVLDTVVLLQGAAKPDGPAGHCLRLATEGDIILVMSDDGLDEIRDVLGRDKIRKRLPQLTDAGVAQFLHNLRALARIVADEPPAFQFERDRGDEHILNLAIAVGASYIVTRDNDLLDLMKEASAAGAGLRAQHPGLAIVDPVAFLAAVSPKSSA